MAVKGTELNLCLGLFKTRFCASLPPLFLTVHNMYLTNIRVDNSLLQNFIPFLGPDSPNTCYSPCLHRPCYPVSLNFRRSLTTICYLFLLTILQTHPLPGRTLWIKDEGFSLFFCNMFQVVALTDRKMKSGMFMLNNLHAEEKRIR